MNHFAIFLIKDIIKREHKRINAFREERGCIITNGRITKGRIKEASIKRRSPVL